MIRGKLLAFSEGGTSEATMKEHIISTISTFSNYTEHSLCTRQKARPRGTKVKEIDLETHSVNTASTKIET